MAQRSVLCVSYDELVSKDRAKALRNAGYDVVSTVSIDQAFQLLDFRKFDLVIVGHRFSHNDKQALIAQSRETWHTPVLLVCGGSVDSDLEADIRVLTLDGTDAIVQGADRMMQLARAS